MKKNKAETDAQDLRDLYVDERTEKKIQEHLTNEDDIITEQDIANAPTGIAEGKEHPYAQLSQSIANEETSGDEIEDEDTDDDSNPEDRKIKPNDQADINTSWNVLGS